MIDSISLIQQFPAYIQDAGKWIYTFCAANHAGLKLGIIIFTAILYLCAALRERRFFGAPAWIIWAAGCAYLGQIYLRENYLTAGKALYGAAAVLMFVYCAMVKGKYGLSEIRIGRRTAVALMIFIIFCASFMRFYNLGDYPNGIINDESLSLRYGTNVMRGEKLEGWWSANMPLVYVYSHSIALFFKLFGVGLVAGRAPMAVFGVLTVIALFLMVGLLLGRAVALFAASFLAICYCASGLERMANGINQGALFSCLFVYLLLMAEKKRSMLCGIISGAMLGLLLATYDPFKAVMLAFLVFVVYRIIFERGYLSKSWFILILVIVSFLVVAGPQLQQQKTYTLLRLKTGYPFFAQPDLSSSVLAQGKTFLSLGKVFLRMLFITMNDSIFLVTETPITNDFLVPLFVLGFVSALYCWRKWNYFLVLAWFIIAPMGGLLSWADTRRIIGFLSAMHIIAALGAFLLLRAVVFGFRLNGRLFFIISLVILTTAIFSVDAYIYFNRAGIRTFGDHKEVAEYVDSQIGKRYVYLVDIAFNDAVYVVTYEKREGSDYRKYYSFIKADEVYDRIFNSPPRNQDVIFIFGKSDKNKALIADIERAMRYAKVKQETSMLLCAIPERDLVEERGADVSYWTARGEAASVQWGFARTMSTEFDWETYPMPYPFRVEMEGFFYVPSDGTYSFRSIGGGDTEVSIDGKQVPLHPTPCVLKGGGHSIRVTHLQNAPGKFKLTWGKRGASAKPVYLWGELLQDMFDLTLPPTPTPMPTPALTSTQTPTVTPTPTNVPTDTPTPTPTNTPTPLSAWSRVFRIL
jgi:hypothetical protein